MPTANEQAFFDDRDAFLDNLQSQVEAGLDIAFGNFLSSLSDNPRDAAIDVLYILMLDSIMPLVQRLPFDARARELVANTDLDAQGATRGLGTVQNALIEALRAKVVVLAGDLASRLGASAANGAFSGAREAALAFLENKKGALISDIESAMLQYERVVMGQVAAMAATDGGKVVFVYAGPRDRKNRAFCAKHAAKSVAYTREAVEDLNNDPDLHSYVPPNVFTLCGGVNCRHMFFPIMMREAETRKLTIIEVSDGSEV